MGLTIHYGFQMSGNDSVHALKQVERLRRRALKLPFKEVEHIKHRTGQEGCDYLRTEPDGRTKYLLKPGGDKVLCMAAMNTAAFAKSAKNGDDSAELFVRPSEIIAFVAEPGAGCESAAFGLRKVGDKYSWQAFCKTGCAEGDAVNFLRCHLSVIAMLDHAQKIGILGWVEDAGKYWEHRDWRELVERRGGWNLWAYHCEAIEDQLIDWFGPVQPVEKKEEFVWREE